MPGAPARPANDWDGFAAKNFREVVALAREARPNACSPSSRWVARYDALMDRYEPA